MNDTTSSDAEPSLNLGHVIGDMSGLVHVGYKQAFDVASASIDVPVSFNLYEGSSLKMPKTTYFHQVRRLWTAYSNANSI